MKRSLIFSFAILGIGFSTSNFVLYSTEKQTFEAEAAETLMGSRKIEDSLASGGYSVSLNKTDEGLIFKHLPASRKLAVRYSSLGVGLLHAAVNNQQPQMVNIHSSGSLKGSFLYAIIDIDIPMEATLTISLFTRDISIAIDQIVIADENLELPPDIWNLPSLPI